MVLRSLFIGKKEDVAYCPSFYSILFIYGVAEPKT